jgi:pseudouridine-5'-phosphate glycosidase
MIRLSEKVAEALRLKKPVVALESTIISHGMPYPENVTTALAVEKVLTDLGVVAATIGIIDGVGVIGMSPEEIESFGNHPNIQKVSRRDLPMVYANQQWGATTVSTTMILAKQAGIHVFATGGIGGVHRKGNETFDISADLQELAMTDVTVVCAGVKSILDIGLTLEYLETHGVPVLGFQTKHFPAFFVQQSGFQASHEVKDAEEVARIMVVKQDEGLRGGILVSVPIPSAHAMKKTTMDRAIKQAIKDSELNQVSGAEITPFLLQRVNELTGGESLASNIALIKNNVRVAGLIAIELCQLRNKITHHKVR